MPPCHGGDRGFESLRGRFGYFPGYITRPHLPGFDQLMEWQATCIHPASSWIALSRRLYLFVTKVLLIPRGAGDRLNPDAEAGWPFLLNLSDRERTETEYHAEKGQTHRKVGAQSHGSKAPDSYDGRVAEAILLRTCFPRHPSGRARFFISYSEVRSQVRLGAVG